MMAKAFQRCGGAIFKRTCFSAPVRGVISTGDICALLIDNKCLLLLTLCSIMSGYKQGA